MGIIANHYIDRYPFNRLVRHQKRSLVGPRAGCVEILRHVEEPGTVGSPEPTPELHDRLLPVHTDHAGIRSDALVDRAE